MKKKRLSGFEKAAGQEFSKEESKFIHQLVTNYNRNIKAFAERYHGNVPEKMTMAKAGELINKNGVGKTIAMLATSGQVKRAAEKGVTIGGYTITENTNAYAPSASDVEALNKKYDETQEVSPQGQIEQLKEEYQQLKEALKLEITPEERRGMIDRQAEIRVNLARLTRQTTIANQADPLYKQEGVPSAERLAMEVARARKGFNKESSVILSNIESAMREIGHTRGVTADYLTQIYKLLQDDRISGQLDNEDLGDLLKGVIEGVYITQSLYPEDVTRTTTDINAEVAEFLATHTDLSPDEVIAFMTDEDSNSVAREAVINMLESGELGKEDESSIVWW